MKNLAIAAALTLSFAAGQAAFAGHWYDGKYDNGHHYSWDEWKNHRTSWEGEHSRERHWDERRMRREYDAHKRHWHY